jgi:hypothetical protein
MKFNVFPRGTFDAEAEVVSVREWMPLPVWNHINILMSEGRNENQLILAMFKFEGAYGLLREGGCAHYQGYVPLVIELLSRLISTYEALNEENPYEEVDGPVNEFVPRTLSDGTEGLVYADSKTNCSFHPREAAWYISCTLEAFLGDNPE